MWEIVVTACFVALPFDVPDRQCIHERSGARGAVYAVRATCKAQARISEAHWRFQARTVGAEVTTSQWRCQRYKPEKDT